MQKKLSGASLEYQRVLPRDRMGVPALLELSNKDCGASEET